MFLSEICTCSVNEIYEKTDDNSFSQVHFDILGNFILCTAFSVRSVFHASNVCLSLYFVDCGTLDAPVNGTVSLTGTYYLDVATFSCDEGFDLVGSQLLTCQYLGSWNGSPARCVQEGSGISFRCKISHSIENLCTSVILFLPFYVSVYKQILLNVAKLNK